MKKIITVILIIVLTISLSLAFTSCNKESNENKIPDPIFFDDFNTLNTSIWNVYDSGVRKGGYWSKDQVFTKNGNLVIRTTKIGDKYYTGAIDTDDKFERHYGYYEAKVLLPKASGMWSAFWIFCDAMKGASSSQAELSGTEIDIFETPYYAPGSIEGYQSAFHIGNYDTSNSSTYYTSQWLSMLAHPDSIEIYDTWHTFALDWQETGYKFYLDNTLMWETNLNGNISSKNSFLFLSCEIDGSNGNAAKQIFQLFTKSISENDDSIFPTTSTQDGNYDSDFLIDYVKVWEKNPYVK